MEDLANACFLYRIKNDLSQKAMGKKCGLSRKLIIDAEHGRKVSRKTAAKINIVVRGFDYEEQF